MGPCTSVGDPEEVPSSWLHIGSSSAITTTLGMKQWVEELPICLSSSLFICLSNKDKLVFLKRKGNKEKRKEREGKGREEKRREEKRKVKKRKVKKR